MSKPTCSSSAQDDDTPLVLDISTGKSVQSSTPVQPTVEDLPDTPADTSSTQPKSYNLCDVVRMAVEERQRVLDEKVDSVVADMLFLFTQQLIPYTLAAPEHFKGLSFDLEDSYRVLYRIPPQEESNLVFTFTDTNKIVSNKLDISKIVYSKLRQSLNAIRGMKCSRAVVNNEDNVASLPSKFDALVIDITKEGLTKYTDEDFPAKSEDSTESETSAPLKDPASVTIYLAEKIKGQIASMVNEHVEALYNAVLVEVVPHMIWQKETYGEQYLRETEDKWYVAVKLSTDADEETLKKYIVKLQTEDGKTLAEIDVTDQVYEKFMTKLGTVIGCTSSREVYEVEGKKVPVVALVINKQV